jgi:ribosome-associated protein
MDSAADRVALRGEYITLAQAVKAVGLADTGGQAKVLVRSGDIRVKGAVDTAPGRKLRAGDRFGTADREWTVSAGE